MALLYFRIKNYIPNEKINIFSIFAFLAIFLLFFSSCENKKAVSESEIPTEITKFVSTHFPDNKIVQTIVEKEAFEKNYEIILDKNYSLEFNKNYEVTYIKGVSMLPESVIPASILEYVKANYPQSFIKKWELDDNRQKVELDNELELEFDKNGNFIKLDD